MVSRYSRQERFDGIGKEGQDRIGAARAVVLGCGALGTVAANLLVRAGVGVVRIVDRDVVELHNLQRQHLFTEADVAAGLPKAVAAALHLSLVNSDVVVDGIVADIGPANIEGLVSDADVVVDGLDNFAARLLVNDACLKLARVWVYGGAVASHGAMMSIRPDQGPCFRCLVPDIPDGRLPTCETAGILGSVTTIVAAYQVAEAMKILTGQKAVLHGELMSFDLWTNTWTSMGLEPRAECPACARRFDYLHGKGQGVTEVMCSAVQVRPEQPRQMDLSGLADELAGLGDVDVNEFVLRFDGEGVSFVLFPDGRAIVNETTDEAKARGIYSKYIGT